MSFGSIFLKGILCNLLGEKIATTDEMTELCDVKLEKAISALYPPLCSCNLYLWEKM